MYIYECYTLFKVFSLDIYLFIIIVDDIFFSSFPFYLVIVRLLDYRAISLNYVDYLATLLTELSYCFY